MPADVSRGGLQFAVGRLGQPEAVCAEEGVEQAGKPAHDSDESNFVRFAVGGEALVAGLGGRLVANRGHGGHVEQVAGLGAATTDGAAAAVLAGVAVEGGEAEEGGGLAAAEAAEFGHGGAEGGGVDGAEAWDRLDDGVATGEFGVGSDAVAHAAVAGSDVGLEGLGGGAEAAGGLGVGGVESQIISWDRQVFGLDYLVTNSVGKRNSPEGGAARLAEVLAGASPAGTILSLVP